MKENSIEEDIEILSRIRNDYHECKKNCKEFTSNVTTINREEYEAIEHILSDYKRVLKENEVLLKENKELQKEIDQMKSLDIYKLVEDWETGQFIPVQKVKDKIEELKKKVEELTDEKGYWGGSDLLEQIEVLQELLEEGDNNER